MIRLFTAGLFTTTGEAIRRDVAPCSAIAFARENPKMKRQIVGVALAACAGAAAAATPVHAQMQAQTQAPMQAWPARQITLIVPFPPGGSTDVVARIMAERMRPVLNQPVITENVGGAGGSIGVGRVARAAPDGYTIDIGQWDTHVGSVIYTLNYDLQRDFEPIGLMSINPQLMVGRRNLPAADLRGLVDYMKANPGRTTLVNQLASAQLAGQLLQKLTGATFQFIPYRGAGPATTDLLAGQVDLMVSQAAVLLPNIEAGTIKPLANLSPRRSAAIPNIPTADESGVPGLHASGWFGLFAPRGTPNEAVARLNAAMVQALADPVVRARFAQLGLDIAAPELQTPNGLAAFHKAEIEKWWPVIRAANIKAE
jgi:tripartite-type tricarboxylate transporter receptor subunit TctC